MRKKLIYIVRETLIVSVLNVMLISDSKDFSTSKDFEMLQNFSDAECELDLFYSF